MRFRQIVLNLLSNAVKFTPKGGSVRLTLNNSSQTPQLVEVEVSDTGIGIPHESLKHLFQVFPSPLHIKNTKDELPNLVFRCFPRWMPQWGVNTEARV